MVEVVRRPDLGPPTLPQAPKESLPQPLSEALSVWVTHTCLAHSSSAAASPVQAQGHPQALGRHREARLAVRKRPVGAPQICLCGEAGQRGGPLGSGGLADGPSRSQVTPASPLRGRPGACVCAPQRLRPCPCASRETNCIPPAPACAGLRGAGRPDRNFSPDNSLPDLGDLPTCEVLCWAASKVSTQPAQPFAKGFSGRPLDSPDLRGITF